MMYTPIIYVIDFMGFKFTYILLLFYVEMFHLTIDKK